MKALIAVLLVPSLVAGFLAAVVVRGWRVGWLLLDKALGSEGR